MHFTNDEALFLDRLAGIKGRLLCLGYTQRQADEWLRKPQALLYGQCAAELLRSDWGYLEVAGVVQRLCDGVFI